MKHFTIKSYDCNGNFKGVLDQVNFRGFTKTVNGGLGECVLEVARPFSNYGEYEDISLNNRIEIIVNDDDTAAESDSTKRQKLIYSGYISKYEPWISGGREGVNVYLLGYHTKLSQDILRVSGATNYITIYTNATTGLSESAPAAAADVGLIMKGLVNMYRTENPNTPINYTPNTITETGTDRTYTFEMMTHKEAIDVILSLAPANWWWYVDADNLFHFKTKPSTPSHRFIFGKHFTSVRIEKSMEKIKNSVLYWDGTNPATVCKFYTDTNSVNAYDRRVEKMIDYAGRAGGATEADSIAQAFQEMHKEPDIQVEATIVDNNEDPVNGYDIESIEIGDTCVFHNFDEGISESFKYNMMITRVDYSPNKAVITIEPLRMGIVPKIEKNTKDINNILTKGAEDTYTT